MPREADSRGNITSETRNGVTVTYEYDELGQLTRVNDPGDPAADSDNGTTWFFAYDRGGNILSKQAYVFSTAALPTEIRQNLIYGYADANWKDKLTHFCNDELTYDAIGNLTGDIKWTYVWEKGRQLKSMHNAATGVTMEFKYNSEGIRTQKVKKVNGAVIETTDYILKGKHVVAMKKNTDTYYFTYDASGRPATVIYNSVKYTYVKNLQGDIVGILDATGNLVVEYKYDAWGDAVSIYSASLTSDPLAFDNPFRYRGYVWDKETELYYLSSRYYNPEISRFINADSLVSTGQRILGNNMHAYCRNNPVRRKDVTGTASVEIFDADGNLLTDDVLRFDGGSVSIGGFGINSSYYTLQKVRAYDWEWQNSDYNRNASYSNVTTGQQSTNINAFDEFVNDPQSIVGKTKAEVGELLGEGWKEGTYGSKGTGWKYNKGDKMVAYHPGGGRHIGYYYKFSSAQIGKIKIVGPDYVVSPNDAAKIFWSK